MVIDEAEIIEAAEQVSERVITFLSEHGNAAPAPLVLDMLRSDCNLSQPLARSALWFMIEQGQLNLGRGMKLEAAVEEVKW